jgi:RNA recognition motif-containing protein
LAAALPGLNMPLDDLVKKRTSSATSSSNKSNNNKQALLPSRRLFVGNLAFSTSWQNLKDHFKTHGNVVFADVLSEPNNPQRSKGCG